MSSALLLISAILNIFLGIYSFLNQPRKFLNKVFLLFSISVSGWIFSIFIILNYSQNIIWGKLPFAFGAFILAFLLLFCISIDNEKNKKYAPLIILFPILMSALTFYNLIIKSVSVKNNFIINTLGPLYNFFVIYIVVYTIFIFIMLIYKYKKSIGTEKLRIKYVFMGILSFVVPAVATNLILPTFFDFWELNTIGPSFSLFMVAAIAYAIVRYHLMDIWVVVRLGIIFTILVTIISFIYVYIGSMIGQFFDHTIAHIITSLIITIGFIPLKNFIEFSTDKIFFRKKYKFADAISRLEEIIHQSGLNIDKILEGVNQLVAESIKAKEAAILILIPKSHFVSRQTIGIAAEEINLSPDNPIIYYLQSHSGHVIDTDTFRPDAAKKNSNLADAVEKLKQIGFSFAVPIEHKGELIGIHLLKQKMSMDPFTKEDIRLLKHMSAEMAFAIDNARMFEELQKLDRTKSEFISVASHQLRTPVSIIKWNLELIFDKETADSTRDELLKTVYENIDTIGQHLDKLMTALEIEDKKIFPEKKENSLKSLILNILKKMENGIKKKELSVETDSAEEIPLLVFDFDKISKSVEALMQNAIAYTQNGGEIKIGWRRKHIGDKDQLVVYVSDSGIGISEHDRANIFKKFFRSQGARNASPNGFGLSLFIAKNFINAHGGDIWFESQGENAGATFYFSIPIEPAKNEQPIISS